MMDRDHTLPVMRQAEMLGISRSGLCYRPRPVSEADLALMHRIDAPHRDMLVAEGFMVGRDTVVTLMRRGASCWTSTTPSTPSTAASNRGCSTPMTTTMASSPSSSSTATGTLSARCCARRSARRAARSPAETLMRLALDRLPSLAPG
ncbi:hypothetical protein GGD89_000391 [Roseospira visakhapatnamensis]|uniref:Uncharacterized protein n=1 Tax=Roseospira visakhapatnamensis TaxID=390880 RepID=A0A7W6W8E7_9PROT|nr:hypothetical protein [Roseospira visakhapatnamensis]